MIIMLVADDRTLKKRFSSYFSPLGYSVVQYSHPLKALDNISDIAPDILLCNAMDYPRHWKLVLKELRSIRERDDAMAILTVPADFEAEEADKAAFLGVNLLYPERLETLEDFRALDSRISRYITHPDQSRAFTWIPDTESRVSFLFKHPREFRLVTGYFTELSPAGGMFRPDDPEETMDLHSGAEIKNASMKAGESLLSLNARVIKNSGTLSLAFTDFSGDDFFHLLEEMNLHVSAV